MLYPYKKVLKLYCNDYGIRKAISDGDLYKITKGIYSTTNNVDLAVVYSKKNKNAILTMDSAFYYYNLTDVIPDKTYLAVPNNSHIKKEDGVVFVYVNENIFNEGKTKVTIDNEDVNIYNKERLLIELIRKRKQIPFDYYKEIINNYRKIADSLDINKIEKYLSLFKNEATIEDALIREVF